METRMPVTFDRVWIQLECDFVLDEKIFMGGILWCEFCWKKEIEDEDKKCRR